MTKINVNNPRVVFDFIDATFRQYFSLVHDGDMIGNVFDELHVVFNHQYRTSPGNFAQELRGFLAFGDRHACHGFVQHHELRILY